MSLPGIFCGRKWRMCHPKVGEIASGSRRDTQMGWFTNIWPVIKHWKILKMEAFLGKYPLVMSK
jgi:hypothetical protein